MISIVYIYPHDDVFQAVKQESAHFAERKADSENHSIFESLVFDEEYLIKFREFFFEAQAEITPVFSAYICDERGDSGYFEGKDFSKDRDYELYLSMPDSFIPSMEQPIGIKINEFIVAYIMFRWLETKSPVDASFYVQRATELFDDIQKLIVRSNKPVRRWHGYF